MLVGTHNRAVNEDFFEVGVGRQFSEYCVPYLCPRSSGKALVHAIPRSKNGVADRAMGRCARPIVRPRQTVGYLKPSGRVGCLAWQQMGNPFILVITEHQSWHPVLPQKTGCKQLSSQANSPLNADCQQALVSEQASFITGVELSVDGGLTEV
jgi:hypothetical protein